MSDAYIDNYHENTAPGFARRKRTGALYRHGGKRLLDTVLVVLAAPLFGPIIFLAWLAMYMGGGSGFFRQVRIGKGGKTFICWKIRTMGCQADEDLALWIRRDPALAAEWLRTQKLADDPRITRLGHFMRRSSIDELPQLWNVLRGDMSLIGPRPFTPDQKELYDVDRKCKAYYQLRPGISGLWQVRSRNQGSFQDRIAFDAAYGQDVSLLMDLKILFLTVKEVMCATGR